MNFFLFYQSYLTNILEIKLICILWFASKLFSAVLSLGLHFLLLLAAWRPSAQVKNLYNQNQIHLLFSLSLSLFFKNNCRISYSIFLKMYILKLQSYLEINKVSVAIHSDIFFVTSSCASRILAIFFYKRCILNRQ